MAKDKKPRVSKRDLIELGVIVVIFLVIYLTGSQAEVFGRVQGLILKTGIMNASVEEDEATIANLNFSLTDINRNEIAMSSFRGKTVFINIWATWCPPCVAEMPGINKLHNRVASEDIVFIMISQDNSLDKAYNWVQKKEFDFDVYATSNLPNQFRTGAVPSTFVISPEGELVLTKTGIANYDTRKFEDFLLGLAQR